MGISEAVMIGDTVDDIKSAISSGVIAFGVVAPGARDPRFLISFFIIISFLFF